MADYKRNTHGGSARPKSFGAKRPGRPVGKGSFSRESSPREVYDVECDNCHERAQVPFRPNGKKPVYCTNCFSKDENGGEKSSYDRRPSFKKEYSPRPPYGASASHASSAPDHRIGDLVKQVASMNATLERLVNVLEKNAE